MTPLSTNIRLLRKAAKITQESLAKKCEVSGAAVSQWESKTNPTQPNIKQVREMAKLFDVTMEQLAFSEDIESTNTGTSIISDGLIHHVFQTLSYNKKAKEVFFACSDVEQAKIFSLIYTLGFRIEPKDFAANPDFLKAIRLLKSK